MIESSYGVPLIRFHQCRLFLETAFPVISSDGFTETTSFLFSLHLYLDANKPRELIRIVFLKDWLALETLVNTFCNVEGTEFILSGTAFNRLRRQLKRSIQGDNEIDDERRIYIIDNLPSLRRYPVMKRIDDFFSAYSIDYDKNEIKSLKKIRDSITHGGKLPTGMNFSTFVDYERKLRALLQRTYLTMLECSFTYSIDDGGFLHPEFAKEEA